ncbi:hypothetical protein [Sulfitobacter sp. 1A13679]|uniref:hypothetical protein n=1 Tax=Sulfitobacter sp. 1A13679 TaxID=3368597 RepID=UPI003746C8AC
MRQRVVLCPDRRFGIGAGMGRLGSFRNRASHGSAPGRGRFMAARDCPPHFGTRNYGPDLTSIYSLPPIHPIKTKSARLNRWLEPSYPLFINHWRRLLGGRSPKLTLSYAKAARRSCLARVWPN